MIFTRFIPCSAILFMVATPLKSQDAKFAPQATGIILNNPSYLIDFDEDAHIAHWVHYELLARETMGAGTRSDDFRKDDRVTSSASPADYKGSGYDRGHIKPAADSKSSSDEMSTSFLMTNMLPQTPSLNRGKWKALEDLVRNWAVEYGGVHITSGPTPESIGELRGGVEIPVGCWKALLRTLPGDTLTIAFLLPNTKRIEGDLQDFALPVDELEQLLGVDLFPALPDAIENRIERSINFDEW
jgi:endonuclease G